MIRQFFHWLGFCKWGPWGEPGKSIVTKTTWDGWEREYKSIDVEMLMQHRKCAICNKSDVHKLKP